jgi:type II secretion system (T2SS) protein G
LTSSAKRWGCTTFCVVAVGGAVALYAYVLYTSRVPADWPLPSMYRTEADLRVLVKAVEQYHSDLGVYPPAGLVGLRRATDHLSRVGNYMPAGPPGDGWGREYAYVPHLDYDRVESPALRDTTGIYAPGAYQIYSAGRDGDPGAEDASAQVDNITSWDLGTRPWRAHYRAAQDEVYRESRAKR